MNKSKIVQYCITTIRNNYNGEVHILLMADCTLQFEPIAIFEEVMNDEDVSCAIPDLLSATATKKRA